MIDRKTALNFLENELHVKNVEDSFKTDKLDLLNRIMRAMQSEMPFHNLWMLKHPHMPSEEEVIRDGLQRRGGLCIHFNYFLMHLLKAFGYDIYLSTATYSASPFPEAHMSCIVRGLGESHHRHLVDVGGYAMFEAVPLHDLPKTYYQTGRYIRYTKSEKEGRYIRWHTKQDNVVTNEVRTKTDGQWCQIFDYSDEEVQYSHFEVHSKPIFTNFHPQNRLLHNFYLTRYPGDQNAAISIIGRKMFKTDDTGFGSASLLSVEEILPTAKKLFPEVSEDDVKIGMQRTAEYMKNDKTNSRSWIVCMLTQYVLYSVLYSGMAFLGKPGLSFGSLRSSNPYLRFLVFFLAFTVLPYFAFLLGN